MVEFKEELPKSMKIGKIVDEAKDIRTFIFNGRVDAKPGQFLMLWIPRLNAKPFGISFQDSSRFGITVCNVGEFTKVLFQKKVGEYVGIFGPYGKSFSTDAKKAVLVGGGYGAAPLAFLADELSSRGADVTLVLGAKSKECMCYTKRFKGSGVRMMCATDDGTMGLKGYSTQVLKDILKLDKEIDMIYTCGPEVMMQNVIHISDEYDIPCEASLERYMKCGFGICGQCCVDDSGVRVCKEGPVFTKEFIEENIPEFGKYKRDGTGAKKHFRR
jgi:dihydroorotate dehydrogenase electron transfer subunit